MILKVCMQGRDINLDIKRVVAYRHWCNKLWNAIKFAMINLGQDFVPTAGGSGGEGLQGAAQLPFACRWILSRLTAAIDTTIKALHDYQFSTATQASPLGPPWQKAKTERNPFWIGLQ